MGRLLNFIFSKKREDFQRLTEERDGNFKFPDDVVRIKDIGYDKRYPERRLDVYRPDDTSRKYPVIVNVHGGGLVMGNKEFNTYFCAQLAKLGFIIFSVEYRLIPNTKIYGQWDDVSRAMDFVAEIAPSFDGDMSNVYMVGDSAGALLIVYALALQKNRRFANTANVRPCTKLNVNAVALISGMFYTTRFDEIGLFMANAIWGKGFRKRGIRRFTDPGYSGIAKHLPPCYLISSDDDPLLHYTRNFMDSLCEANVQHELCLFPGWDGLGHAFPVFSPDLPESRAAMKHIAEFFHQYRKGDVRA